MSRNFVNIVIAVICWNYAQAATNEAVHPMQPRHCFNCVGINCQRTTRTNITEVCTDLLDICVTIFDGYSVVANGCYLDLPEEHRRKCDVRDNPECVKCFGQLCNNKGRRDFRCIECNSKDNTQCKGDTSAMTPTQCSIPTASNSYCYVRALGTTMVSRGCFVHTDQQMECMRDDSCSMCLSNDGVACNSYRLDPNAVSSADRVHNALTLAAILFLALLLLRSTI